MSNSSKEQSPLVTAVLALDNYFSELNRLSTKIEESELKTDFDFEQMQKLLNRFTGYGEGVSAEVHALSQSLNESRTQAEAAAQKVSAKAIEFQTLQQSRQQKMDQFRQLGEKVRALNTSLLDLKRPEGSAAPTDADHEVIAARLTDFEKQLTPLIDEAEQLKNEAQAARMKILEQGADSLRQSLLAVNQRLGKSHSTEHPLQ